MQWQVQEAKQRFSEVLRAVEAGEPQIVTRHGQEIAVIIDIEGYHRLRGQSMTFMEFLRTDPLVDADLDTDLDAGLARASDRPREVDLTD